VNKKYYALRYLLADIIAAAGSWTLFYVYRKTVVEPHIFGYKIPLDLGSNFVLGIMIIPLFWVALYYLSGFYRDPFHKSRLNEFGQTFIFSLVGVTILFFALILDDVIVSYKNYYASFLVLFLLHFTITYIPRYIITANTERKIRKRIITFNTLLVGSSDKAFEIYSELENPDTATGNKILGFVPIGEGKKKQLDLYIPQLGSFTDLKNIVKINNVEEVIIALESSEHQEINKIINILHECNVIIKAIPDLHDILTGKVKIETIYGAPLISISRDLMPHWQANFKRYIDISFSIFALVLLSPLILFIMIGIKVTSKGRVFLRQERIGRFGKPFNLYKFRSMYENAELNGPELTKKNDPRLTPFGSFLRKRKLDEIPNFWNVIKGDMSLVGPRPERQFFIDKIVKKAPHYVHLHKVKPGITSWGQVRFGYAENVEQMIKRLEYDLIYIESMSLFVDFQIIIYTLVKIVKGKHV
jgi:exopolysaccharide biosynthesis polyprenyl glycosylphosphotransferase